MNLVAPLQRLRLGARLGICFGAVIGGSALAVFAAAWSGQKDLEAVQRAEATASERTSAVAAIRESQLAATSSIRSAGLQSDSGDLNKDIAAYRAALKTVVAQEEKLVASGLGAQEKAVLDKAVALRKQAEPMVEEAIQFTMAMAGDEAAKVLTKRFAPVEKEWAAQLVQLTQLMRERAAAEMAEIDAARRQRTLVLSIFVVAVIAAGAALALVITRSVTRPLQEAGRLATRVAEGDLTVDFKHEGDDEVAELMRSLQTMARQLAAMVSAVRDSAESIDMASREITQGNLDLSTRTEQQASSVQQTASSLLDLTGLVNKNSETASSVRKLADRSAVVAGEGGQAMEQVSQTMSSISESSKRIADIIGVIDSIAFQTNILALNAAVEAARAGEQGRGFAVVASEVRALAHRVSSAASEVRQLIGESVERVDAGAGQIDGLGNTMRTLVASVREVHALVGQISDASVQQSAGLNVVNTSVQSIDTSTQQNAALVEEVAAAAQSLSGQTQQLNSLVAKFRIAG
jgi:methyl-accepting chemotaxis protein